MCHTLAYLSVTYHEAFLKMIPRTLSFFAALSLASVFAITGCATETSSSEDDGAEENDLTAAGKALIGSYKGESGPIYGLILTPAKATGQANEFIADVDTGIRCAIAPCPSREHVTGTFTASSKSITLKSSTASDHAKRALGKYSYTHDADTLAFSRKGVAETLDAVDSYCSQASDCGAQGIIHPMCVGGFVCTAENTCSYHCGIAPVSAPQ